MGSLLPAVARLTVAVLATVVCAEPVGLRQVAVTLVAGDGVLVGVAELHAGHPAALREVDPRVVQADQRKVGVIRDERLRNFRDRREVLLELGELELPTPPSIEEALGLNDARITGLAGDSARGETGDELLQVRQDPILASLLKSPIDLGELVDGED